MLGAEHEGAGSVSQTRESLGEHHTHREGRTVELEAWIKLTKITNGTREKGSLTLWKVVTLVGNLLLAGIKSLHQNIAAKNSPPKLPKLTPPYTPAKKRDPDRSRLKKAQVPNPQPLR